MEEADEHNSAFGRIHSNSLFLYY